MPDDHPAKPQWSTLRIDASAMDLLYEEQVRLRKVEGRKSSYSDILRRLWSAYKAAAEGTAPRPAVHKHPKRDRALEAFLAWYQTPGDELDEALKTFIRTLIEQREKKPDGNAGAA